MSPNESTSNSPLVSRCMLIQKTTGQLDFRHDSGEISIVQIEIAGIGAKRVRIANLPLEVSDRAIRDTLSTYGDVKEIREKTLSRAYKYPVSNWIRVVITALIKQIPSHLAIAGIGALISYEGQSPTCYGCNGVDHQYLECPRRKLREKQQPQTSRPSWADIVLKEITGPQSAIVRPPTTDIQVVTPETAQNLKHRLPRQDVMKAGKQSQKDSTTPDTASSPDTNEDGMQRDDNPLRPYEPTKKMLGEATCWLKHPYLNNRLWM